MLSKLKDKLNISEKDALYLNIGGKIISKMDTKIL